MGMFDSFIVKYNGTKHEVQTKRFDNLLDVWRIGDVINQPSFGVQVLYELAENVDGKLEYAFEEDADTVIYIVIVNGVYVESIVGNHVDSDYIAKSISELEESWSNTNKQLTTFNTYLNAKQELNKTYHKSLYTIAGYIDAYRSRNDKKKPNDIFTELHYPELENIKSDSDLINVLLVEVQQSLAEREKPLLVIYNNDPLARYRV